MADLKVLATTLDELSIEECAELVPILEKKWGVKANPYEGMEFQQQEQQEEKKEAKTEWDVELSAYPADKKMAMIKLIRAITGKSLIEARDTLNSLPVVLKEGLSEHEAGDLKGQLESEGATVALK
jgi:large subunit ribosomal protein L7/L12